MEWLIGGVVTIALLCLWYIIYGPAFLDRRDDAKRLKAYRARWQAVEDDRRKHRMQSATKQQDDSAA